MLNTSISKNFKVELIVNDLRVFLLSTSYSLLPTFYSLLFTLYYLHQRFPIYFAPNDEQSTQESANYQPNNCRRNPPHSCWF